jgi:hypothetical protein
MQIVISTPLHATRPYKLLEPELERAFAGESLSPRCPGAAAPFPRCRIVSRLSSEFIRAVSPLRGFVHARIRPECIDRSFDVTSGERPGPPEIDRP